MAILVTGGAGYIGSHTCVELLNAGYEIVVVDNFTNSHPESLRRVAKITNKKFKIYQINIHDKKALENVFSNNNITAVMHFAGLKAVGESTLFPLLYYRNNIMSTIILCEVMKEYGVKKLVFSSSATVYGKTDQIPINENTPLMAINPYGHTKQMIEQILQDLYCSDQTWCIYLLRYFNPIGAHESGLIGEDPNGLPNNLLPYISQVAMGKLEMLNIYGDDYPTTDGTGVRDYIHVVDLAKGHVRALENISEGIDSLNLGTGKGYSVLEVIKAFEKVSDRVIPYQVSPRRQGDVAISYANPEKAMKNLNWQANRGIDIMCRDVWRWQFNNPNGYENIIDTEIIKGSPLQV